MTAGRWLALFCVIIPLPNLLHASPGCRGTQVPVEKITEIPVERIVEKIVHVEVEKIVEVPVERIVEKFVTVPIINTVEVVALCSLWETQCSMWSMLCQAQYERLQFILFAFLATTALSAKVRKRFQGAEEFFEVNVMSVAWENMRKCKKNFLNFGRIPFTPLPTPSLSSPYLGCPPPPPLNQI